MSLAICHSRMSIMSIRTPLRLAEPLDRLGYFDQDALPADWCRECVPTRLLALEIRRLLWRMNTATVWCYK